MSTLEHLYPERVFYYFKQIAAIPHGSGNTKAISDYLVKFAKEHALTWYQDEANNVVLVKEASKGYEKAPAIIIQGHMDMVCEKEKDCALDMDKEGLRLYVDGDFLKAEGTTLGGDDGIAVAYALAILESDEISHPKLEVVITVDEEIGMLGAAVMDLSMLTGHTMLNIDSDEEGIFLTGCAGGMALNVSIPVTRVRQTGKKLSLIVTGLSGGHSGSEIDKEHGNADLLMGRLLYGIFSRSPFGILTLHGGLKDNAIPRECEAEILIPKENTQIVCEYVKELNEILKKELVETDPGVQVLIEEQGNAEAEILDYHSVSRVIFYLRNVPNGIQHMSQLLNGQVETSLNLGILELKEDALTSLTSIRSSVKTRKEDLCARVTMLVEMLGGEAEVEGDYPAWEYRMDSALRPQVEKVYEELFHKKPVFSTIHAGLECGLLSEKIPDLDCVSFGPDNFDIHTPKEHLSISSTARVWDFLVAFLTVNDAVAKKPDLKVDPEQDQILFDHRPVIYEKYSYYLFHKPAGCVTARCDRLNRTVMDFFPESMRKEFAPVGRLDKDTEGFLLITNDGELTHRLLSPAYHVKKTYFVQVDQKIPDMTAGQFAEGVDIGDEKRTLPADLKILGDREAELTISEGRFHQVKRMFASVGCKVTYLKRISMGTLTLGTLEKATYRKLTEQELASLKKEAENKQSSGV